MATIISSKTSGVGGLSVTGDASGVLQLASADGTAALTINASQNVGIGTSSLSNGVHVSSSVSGGQLQLTYPSVRNYTIGATSDYALAFRDADANAERMRIDSSGALILAGSTAQKATGTTWSNPSDIRLKDNITEYAKGLDELMQVSVKEWEYNGKGGTPEGLKGLGVIADEVMLILPNTVENYKAKLNSDDEEDSDIKKFDATEITWLMLKSIQELKAIIDTQNARIEALEGVNQ